MTGPAAADRGHEASLRRDLGVVLAASVIVNASIGTGIFKVPAKIARLSGSVPVALAVWTAGGLLALAGALSLAELAAAMPRTGGIYEYIRRAYGPRAAFLVGWTKLVLLTPAAVGSFALLAAEAIVTLGGDAFAPFGARPLAALVIAACAGANLLRVRSSALQQGVLTAVKLAGVALLAVVGLSWRGPPVTSATFVAPAGAATSGLLAGPFAALVAAMWAYDGWADVSFVAGEVRAPGRTLPRALVLGTLAVISVYLAANVGFARVLGFDGLASSGAGREMVAARVAEATLGHRGQAFLALLVLVSCIGACMESLLTGSRMLVPMATDGVFFRSLGAVSKETGVPVRAVLVAAALGISFVAFRSFEQLTNAFVVGYFPFYALAVYAVVVLRRREPELERPFRVPGYPWVPLLFVAGAGAVVAGGLADVDRSAALAFGVVAAGLPVHALWARRRTAG